ncbi:MAG TPA: glycoside hydrolase family 2 TIM barrel-domain containing protein, partial [Kiritimatiellia bacterium]|nr:glycoside hydrolase family 2 TIM barrel-domain containing protein [Kiritimatiellia bacterium]
MKQGMITWAVLTCLLQTGMADVPRPEHPRPDAIRENWLTLNGEWQFEIDDQGNGEARGLIAGKDLASKIIVPFCPESKLSGLALGNTQYMTNVWYRRTFELPAAMKGKRVLLHFGGVDYKTWAYVNGQLAGTHMGGNAAFGFEITTFLKEGPNEVVVRVVDHLRSGLQPGGKQAYDKSQGCVYTRTTGIWQSVWLEAVGTSYVESFSVVPDPEHARVLIEATVNGADPDLELKAEAFADGKRMGADSAAGTWRNRRLVLELKKKRLWEPGAPFLYDLTFTLTSRGKVVDQVQSYFGLRSVAIEGRRILINGKPVFQRTILDQGFYPDGIWTAPTDAALKGDIELSMACGFNGARLHQKVFEPRFLYWADKLGYLVWGEFPNWGYNYRPEGYAPYVTEWTEVLLRDRNHPSVIGWCPFNETPASAGEIQQVVWAVTKAVDPTRPVLETSGWVHTLPHPEVRDAHDYDGNPESLRKRWEEYFSGAATVAPMPPRYGHSSTSVKDCGVPFMISEFGGIGWATEG